MKLILYKLLILSFCTLDASEQSLFDGESLNGWIPVNINNAKYWSVKDGVITASNNGKKMPVNTYLATEKSYQNFEFKCKFRLSGDHKTGLINSGIQYRSLMKRLQGKSGVHKIIGYQADIGKGWWGGIYDEHRRGLLSKGNTKDLFKNFKEDGWNEYIIRCVGNKHELFINGHKTIEYIEKDSNIESYGVIALQLHSGGIAKMEYKDISIKEFPPSNMSLPLFLGPQETEINGKTLARRGNMIVSWNKTHEFLEWQVPQHFKQGNYKIIFHYMNDINRQGSEMKFTGGLQETTFLTKSQRKQWGPEQELLGVFNIKPGNKLQLYCSKLKADWVLDFLRLEFIPVSEASPSKITFSIHDTKIHGQTLKRARGMIVSWNKTNEYLEWVYPESLKKSSYKVTLKYMCDKNRKGSDMVFSIGSQSVEFKTESARDQWGEETKSLGEFQLNPGDKIQLRCKKIKADWVMDFLSLSCKFSH